MQDTAQPCFRALGDPTRREIIRILARSDLSIAQVTDRFDMTRAAVKKHLTILSDGGLITVKSHGRERINQLNLAGLTPVLDWLQYFDVFWDNKLAALKTAIEKDMK